MRLLVKAYYQLTKPGIVYGNLLHALIGFLIASSAGFDSWILIGLMVGTATIIAAACVVNNIIDRKIDSRMKRTKQRALVTGEIDMPSALLFAIILITIGTVVLLKMTNWMVLVLALVAFIWYVWIYGWAKRHTWWSTVIGTVPGSLPIMAGYVSIAGQVDLTAWLLFAAVTFWQIPHFYAIALYRKDEYAAADLPVASLVLSRRQIYCQMLLTAVLHALSFVLLIANGGLVVVAGLIVLVAASYWIFTIYSGRNELTDSWARRVFKQSLFLTIALLMAAIYQSLSAYL